MDRLGLLIAEAHLLLGHDKCAFVLGQDPGPRDNCLLCTYEQSPTPENKRAVEDALKPPQLSELAKEVAAYMPPRPRPVTDIALPEDP